MRQWSLGLCFALLLVLTLVNAWWQHNYYSAQVEALEQQHEVLQEEMLSHRRDLTMQKLSLDTCRLEVEAAQEKLRWAANHRSDAGFLDRNKLRAERDGLAEDLRACQDRAMDLRPPAPERTPQGADDCTRRLQSAVRALRRLRNSAHERALDAQASAARLLSGASAVTLRANMMRGTMDSHIATLEQRVDVAVDMYAEHLARESEDIGYKLDSKDIRRVMLQRINVRVRRRKRTSVEGGEQQGPQPLSGSIGAAGGAASVDDESTRAASAGAASAGAASSGASSTGEVEKTCVAAIIPFRGRGAHLATFYKHIASFLESPEARRLCWSFYIVEQFDTELFNRGWLFNVGFAMAQLEQRKFQCLAIQDLDTLPEIGAGVDFADCALPTQLSSEIECYGWLPPYAYNAGGVVTMSTEHWQAINGFSNSYEGWGGEDDDLRLRMAQLGLLRSSCGDFCSLTDRAFNPSQEDLIHRPPRGRGRFICLDEKSHTPRKHGNKEAMQQKLREMEMGSDRWAVDGLSNLRFELVRHESRRFPNASGNATLHWLKAVPSLGLRFEPKRVQLVLAEELCSEACQKAGRCILHPAATPISMSELQLEVSKAFSDCIVGGSAASSLGYWLIDRRVVVTSLRGTAVSNRSVAQSSWVLNEVLREALSSSVDGEPALVVRAVPMPRLIEGITRLRSDPRRVQQPLVSACVGFYQLEDFRLGLKHTVNVGSDDCEQRSWTHLASFKALRHPRNEKDVPICIGEADEVWTARISRSLNCSGMELGVLWRHKDVFYIGDDAVGHELCVRYRIEGGDLAKWSRWQVVPKRGGRCGSPHDGYKTSFVFRSMEDVYQPPRLYLCARVGRHHRLQLELDCRPGGSSSAYAVLRPELARNEAEVYCIGRSALGDRLLGGPSCNASDLGTNWSHVAAFAVPANATGAPWCLGRSGTGRTIGTKVSIARFWVASRLRCDGTGYSHILGFREVLLTEMTPEHGLLSLSAL